MRRNSIIFGCFSLIIVYCVLSVIVISLSNKQYFYIQLVAKVEYSQLNDDLDLAPQFDTNEKLLTIDDDKIRQTSQVVFDNFVLNYKEYPETEINQLIKRSNFFDKSGSNQKERYIPETIRKYNKTAINLCRTNSTTIQPQQANSQDGRWVVIINQKNFVQTVPVEECYDRVNSNSNFNRSLFDENTNNIKCRQAYSTIDLMVAGYNKVIRDKFQYPSACEPYIESLPEGI